MPRAIFLLLILATQSIVVGGQAEEKASPDRPPPAPRFALKDLQGRVAPLKKYRGKIVVINFWATWRAIPRRDSGVRPSAAEHADWAGVDRAGPRCEQDVPAARRSQPAIPHRSVQFAQSPELLDSQPARLIFEYRRGRERRADHNNKNIVAAASIRVEIDVLIFG